MFDSNGNGYLTCELKFIQIYHAWSKYILHSLQGHFTGVHFLIFDLKPASDTLAISFGVVLCSRFLAQNG